MFKAVGTGDPPSHMHDASDLIARWVMNVMHQLPEKKDN